MKMKWSWVDYVLATFRLGLLIQGVIFFLTVTGYNHINMQVLLLWFLICIIVPHLFWNPRYTHKELYILTEFLLAGSFYIYINIYTNIDTQASLLIMPALVSGYLATKRTAIIVPILLFALSLFLFWFEIPLQQYFTQLFMLIMMYGFGFSFGKMLSIQQKIKKLLDDNQQKNQLIESQNKTLEQYARKVEELTLQTERNRLAVELHDTIGHTITSVIVGMDSVNALIDRDIDKAKERLTALRKATASGLDTIRKHIHGIAINEENLSLSSVLGQISKEFSDYTSTEILWNIEGNEYEVSKSVKLTLSRCLQEGLTNAKRHGNATSIKVNLEFESNQIILSIHDNGKGSDELTFGFGFNGMKDRLSTLQGELTVHSKSGQGTSVICVLPVREKMIG
jgi:signal transduction histidine kinase